MLVLWLTFAGLALVRAGAEVSRFYPAADTTLIQAEPTHNMGGQSFFNAGTTGTGYTNRALLRFEFGGQIPHGARVLQARLRVEVVGQPAGNQGQPSSFALHRLLQPWGEGSKISETASPGLGLPASVGEATWQDRFTEQSQPWRVAGGTADADYVALPSASQFIEDLSDYTFESTVALVGDIQLWIDHPEKNYGWLLRSLGENTPYTARRFASREDPSAPPLLEVEFLPPLLIEQTRLTAGRLHFSFLAEANQSYRVEFQPALPGQVWLLLTNVPALPAPATITISDPAAAASRFYRVVAPPSAELDGTRLDRAVKEIMSPK